MIVIEFKCRFCGLVADHFVAEGIEGISAHHAEALASADAFLAEVKAPWLREKGWLVKGRSLACPDCYDMVREIVMDAWAGKPRVR